jgi:P27 family predicted phage terminase small subunit
MKKYAQEPVDDRPAFNRIQPPAGLEIKAQRLFNMIVDAQDPDFFKESDIPLLLAYISLLKSWASVTERLEKDINSTGVMLIANNGARIVHPCIAAQAKLASAISGICAKLKLSPSARIPTASKHANVTLTRPADKLDSLFLQPENFSN